MPAMRANLTVLGLTVPPLLYVWFIHLYGANSVFQDQWSDINLLRSYYGGTLDLGSLWGLHGDHRMLFPNLLVLAQANVTHLNVVFEEYLGAFLLVCSVILVIWAHRRRAPGTPWWHYFPVAILMLSLVQYEDTLWGYQMAWYLVLTAFAVMLVLLDRPRLTGPVLLGAVVAAVIGSFSSLQGLLIWPVGLLLVVLRRRQPVQVAAWVACGVVTSALYYFHFNPTTSSHPSYLISHPLAGLEYILLAVGSVVGEQYSNPWVIGFGLLVLALAIWTLIRYGLRRSSSGGGPVGASLTVFGLLFVLLIAQGRASLGFFVPSRYSTYLLLIVVGTYLMLLGQHGKGSREMAVGTTSRVATGALAAVLLLQVVFGTYSGIVNARTWHARQVAAADITANMAKASDVLVAGKVVNLEYGPRELLPTLRDHHLALFGTSAADRYAREGLLPGLSSVSTRILRPKNGEAVSGTELLGATALDPSGIARVEFRLTGHGHENEPIVSARPYGFAVWAAQWNTASVPDGRYTLSCVAYGTGGRGYRRNEHRGDRQERLTLRATASSVRSGRRMAEPSDRPFGHGILYPGKDLVEDLVEGRPGLEPEHTLRFLGRGHAALDVMGERVVGDPPELLVDPSNPLPDLVSELKDGRRLRGGEVEVLVRRVRVLHGRDDSLGEVTAEGVVANLAPVTQDVKGVLALEDLLHQIGDHVAHGELDVAA